MKIAAALLVVICAGAAANASVILSQWNFNSTVGDANTATGVNTPSVGAGTALTVGGVTSAFASGQAGTGSTDPELLDDSGFQTTTFPVQGAGNKTAGVQFNVSTVGFSNVIVSWDQRHSNTASRFAQFQYSTDGTTFNDFGAAFAGITGDTWFNNRSIDLSSVAGVDNNASFAFRIVAAFAASTTAYTASSPTGTYAGGTWRFDMVTVTVPTPGALTLAGLGTLVATRRRRA